jgi:hypothetical protein
MRKARPCNDLWQALALGLFALFFANSLPMRSQPQINRISPQQAAAEQYEKYEIRIDLSAQYTNPYDYEEVGVKALFTGPHQETFEVDGFYQEYFSLHSQGSLVPEGTGFTLRFAPMSVGRWTYQVIATDRTGTTRSLNQSFDCLSPGLPENHGFVRSKHARYLEFDDGDAYLPIGANMCWQQGNPFLDYQNWLGKLKSRGGNYLRVWHAHWGLGIEWKNGWQRFEGLRKYEQQNCRYQDWLFDYCAENGIYLMLCLQHHGQVSTRVNPNWADNPYNAANGGPCSQCSRFFTDPQALAHTQNRFRYIVARWGYARSLLAWELFNEVDWSDAYLRNEVEVMNWHIEMAAFLRSIDPYQHLRTTSFAHDHNDPLVWAHPDIDFTQTHYYLNAPQLQQVLADGSRYYTRAYAKPSLNGEFGIGLSSNLATVDPDGIHFHNALWGSLFGGGLGTAMSWWWDIYLDPQDLYHHFEPLARVAGTVPFLEDDMAPAKARVENAPGSLSLMPTGDWGVIGEDSLVISKEGVLSPAQPVLGKFLYGAQWNTQYRSPPVFEVDYPAAGGFAVRCSDDAGTSPRIAIWLDGTLLLNQAAAPHGSYRIQVPAGKHHLRVDNPGTDWISIAAYEFEGLGSAVAAYVLKARDEKSAAGWVLNKAYNHQEVPAGTLPSPIRQARLRLQGFQDSSYYVKWYDCLSGAMVHSQALSVRNEVLRIDLPDLYWDLAFVVDEQAPIMASNKKEIQHLGFQLFPNPAQSGQLVKLQVARPLFPTRMSLLDRGGKVVHDFSPASASPTFHMRLPEGLAGGLYWLRVEDQQAVGVKALLVR